MPFSSFNNVFLDKASDYELSNLSESEALKKTLIFLSTLMSEKFNDYIFYILSSNNPTISPTSACTETNKKKVLISISDESGSIPNSISNHYHAIFKSYLRTNTFEIDNIFNFPLSCVKEVPEYPILPINERLYSVFFSGNLNNNRVDFYLSLLIPGLKIPKISCRLTFVRRLLIAFKSNFDSNYVNSYIRFTKGFKQGILPIEYGRIIANSCIVLCPSGISSSECFRHYEALRAGCVIISTKLPNTHFYQSSPIIQIDNWSQGLQITTDLMANPIEMQRLSNLAQKWWVERCSEEATAQFVFKNLTYLNNR